MSQLVQEALDGALGAGASYADARLHRRVDEQYAARRQQVSEAARTESVGLAVRVLHHGAWGFAATAEFAPAAVRRAAALAVANAAAAAATQRQKVRLADELVEEADLLAHTAETAAEAAALQTAPPCPSGVHDVILDPRQLSLQIHESVGHPLELDRVLGGEADFAGTSFATPDHLGERLYGSPLVHLTADATLERGLGTFAYDHEGVEAQKWPLIEEGVLRGYLTSRESAGAVAESRSRGTMRADGWRRVPIVRMVNISLEPGPEPLTLEELLADTRDGLYLSTNRSWSIDQRRLNFQFGCEIGWEIKGGKLGRMLRNPTYWDITPRFWGSCDAICGPDSWEVWGVFNCGKGQPMQTCQMSHGSSPARFRDVPCGGGT